MIDSPATRRREGGNVIDNSSSDTVSHEGHLHYEIEKAAHKAKEDRKRRAYYELEGEDRHITLKDRLKQYVA